MKEQKINHRKSNKPLRVFVLSGIAFLTLIVALVLPSVLYPLQGQAQIPVVDAINYQNNLTQWLGETSRDLAYTYERAADKIEYNAAAVAYKSALHLLLNNFAYDAATWLASGGKGQTPYFHTDTWGEYLSKAVDGAAGEFVAELGKDWLGFNVCNPDLPFRLNLTQGFQDNFRRRRPDCTASQLARDWERFVQRDDFIDHFVQRFDSRQNEILIGIELYDRYYQFLSFEYFNRTKDREEGGGFEGVTSAISGQILTPAGLVDAEARELIRQGHFESEKVHTGSIVGDAISTFVETLAGKLFQRLFREGLASLRDDDSRGFIDPDLYTGDSGRELFTGRQAAESRYVTLVDAGIVTGGPYEILQQLVSCRNLNNPGPDECVIDQDFRLAIEQEMTVREAIDSGQLDGNAPFGFVSQGFEPPYNEGYPYRSLIILRTHRIVPVTWELAAQIINRGFGGSDRVVTLNTLIAEYDNADSPFFHLIDQHWVLKAPETFCKAEGFGPVIINDRVTNDGQRQVTRSPYCADYQSCIEKDSDGNCIYGYCTEERPTWNLQAESCLAEYSTCQSFRAPGGDTATYLQNTLDFNGCSADNAGCQWYCQSYNVVDGVWSCVNAGEQVLKPCANAGGCGLSAGCSIAEGGTVCTDAGTGSTIAISATCNSNSQWWQPNLFGTGQGGCQVNASCTVEFQGVECIETGCENTANQLANASFETGGQPGVLAANWSAGSPGYFERVSGGSERIKSGRNSIRFYNAGGPAGDPTNGVSFISNPITLPAPGSYTFSGYAFDSLNSGSIEVSVSGAVTGFTPVILSANAKHKWNQVSFDFTAAGTVQIAVRVFGNQVSGTAWFDSFKVSESCIVNPVRLTLPGTVAQDQSKIHLDNDAVACNIEGDGCSAFYTSPTNRITNLLFGSAEPSFEVYEPSLTQSGDQVFKNWLASNSSPNRTVVTASSDAHSGSTAMQVKEGSGDSYVVHSVNLRESVNNRRFIVSYYAKVVDAAGFTCNAGSETLDNGGGVPLGCHSFNGANYLRTGGSSPAANIPLGGISSANVDGNWKRFFAIISVNNPVVQNVTELEIVLRAIPSATGSILYDDIQIEDVSDLIQTEPSAFQGYTTLDQTYIRKAPSYLGCQGFTLDRPSDYVLSGVLEAQCIGDTLVWRPDSCTTVGGTSYCCHEIDPAECFSYALYCQADEVGCQAFAPLNGGPTIPATVAAQDYCPQECVGYDAFKQAPTFFESTQSLEFFIPQTATQCSAAEAGCDEFTNLDEVAAGGEGLEYYSYLRQCVKPADTGANCGNFYSWQGSDDTGFQLRVYELNQTAPNSNIPAEVIQYNAADPSAVNYPDTWCNDKSDANSNGLPDCCDGAEDLAANPFCKELIDSGGQTHYLIYDNTISCADDCHPFRKTRLGESATDAQANCVQSRGTWTNDACIYNAIADQGVACRAAAAGCRDYRGDAAGNIFTAFYDNFEDGDIRGWVFGSISSEALSVGGHSIKTAPFPPNNNMIMSTIGFFPDFGSCDASRPHCSDTVTTNCYDVNLNKCVAGFPGTTETCLVEVGENSCSVLNNRIDADKSYILSFWAKSADSQTIGLDVAYYLPFPSARVEPISRFQLGPEWQYYTFGPFDFAELNSSRTLAFFVDAANRDAFIDNIDIKEVVDHVYVIKNSWQTPLSCDTNPFVDPAQSAPQFMLGCEQYRDTNSQIHNLKSFNGLCRESAVGCEAMVDTFNSSSPFSQEFNVGDDVGYISVPNDAVTYLTNRPEFNCDANQKGCQKLGLPNIDQTGGIASYADAYLINNPDQYNATLCSSGEVGCQEYQTSQGFAYFKDPGVATCEYREIPGQSGFGWFKIGSVSLTPDCPIVRSPLGIVHPTDGWAGLCPAEASGCTEFIDPVSNNSKNLVFNADFDQNLDGNTDPDGWKPLGYSPGGSATNFLAQKINLKRNTLYTVTISNEGNGDHPELNSSNLHVEIADCPGITSFDHSMVGTCTAPAGSFHNPCTSSADCGSGGVCATDRLQIPPSDFKGDWDRRPVPELPAQREYSARFFVPAGNTTACTLLLVEPSSTSIQTTLLKEVSVRETSVHHVLESDVDRTSCNGIVDELNGCVLFNDRSAVNFKIGEADTSYLRFDSDMSGPGINNGVPVSDCGGACDSNSILKVRPDRTCGEWLDCQTKVKAVDKNGNEVTYCVELAACSDLNEKGECINFILPDRQKFNENVNANTTVPFSDHDKIAYLSGYAKAGSTLAGAEPIPGSPIPGPAFASQNTIEGYYPFNLMNQFGEVARVANGSFEDYPELEYPVGWAWENNDGRPWEAHRFRVISNVVEAQDTEGVSLLGRGSLKVSSDHQVISDPVAVLSNTTYVLNVSVNTLNLQPQAAKAVIELVNESGSVIPSTQITVDSRLDWQNRSVIIPSTAITGTTVRVRLKNQVVGTEQLAGATFFDNIAMLPSLAVRDLSPFTGLVDYVNRSCRVYPQQDSLACRYRDQAGAIQQGWSGYCLETDPQRPGVCLQWWPIDLIKGDGFGTYVGYNNRYPLYYCIEAQTDNAPVRLYDKGELRLNASPDDPTTPTDLPENPEPDDECEVIGIENPGGGSTTWNTLEFPDGTEYSVSPSACSQQKFKLARCRVDINNQEAPAVLFHLDFIDRLELRNAWSGVASERTLFQQGCPTDFSTPNAATLQEFGNAGSDSTDTIPWMVANDGDGHCTFGAKATFDTNGFLDELWFWYTDDSSECTNAGHVWEVVADVYLDRAYCTTLVQTVSPVGENKAWVSRVQEGSIYDRLECSTNGIDSVNPLTNVCALGVDCTWSGNSYWCGGVQNGERCSVCTSNTDYQPFGAAVLEDPFNITNENQLFWMPPDLENFDPPYQARMGQVPYNSDPSGAVQPTNEFLKRIFAQSFGFWRWQPQSANICIGGTADGSSCAEQTCPGGSCEISSAKQCSGGGSICEVATCPAPQTCDAVANEGGEYRCNGVGQLCCPGASDSCDTYHVCSVGSDNAGSICSPDPDLNQCPGGRCGGTQAGFQPVLNTATLTSGIEPWGPPTNLCTPTGDNTRPVLPENISPRDPAATDYCSVAPRVQGITVNNQNGASQPVKIINQRGSGQVTLFFNAVIDGNQLPLTAYQVDWGDGSKVAVSGTNLRDRSNAAAPYKLTHSYSYYEVLSKNQTGDGIFCSVNAAEVNQLPQAIRNDLPSSWCAIKPRVQIQDNWGWCNGRIDPNNPSTLLGPAGEWGYRVGGGSPNCSVRGAGENNDAWTYFGGSSTAGYVIVGVND